MIPPNRTKPSSKLSRWRGTRNTRTITAEAKFTVYCFRSVIPDPKARFLLPWSAMKNRRLVTLILLTLLPLCFAQSQTTAKASAKSRKAKTADAKSASPAGSSVYPIKEGFVDGNGVLIYYTELGHGAPLM